MEESCCESANGADEKIKRSNGKEGEGNEEIREDEKVKK